jgi:hypothetical protein
VDVGIQTFDIEERDVHLKLTVASSVGIGDQVCFCSAFGCPRHPRLYCFPACIGCHLTRAGDPPVALVLVTTLVTVMAAWRVPCAVCRVSVVTASLAVVVVGNVSPAIRFPCSLFPFSYRADIAGAAGVAGVAGIVAASA